MMGDVIKNFEVGYCGNACGACRFFGKECRGCRIESENLKDPCIIARCAKEKGVSHCLVCLENPCALKRRLLKSYCPVYENFARKFGIMR